MSDNPQPIDTAPRDRWILLSGGGWTDAVTGEAICQPAVARWMSGTWVMRDSAGRYGYEAPSFWSEIAP